MPRSSALAPQPAKRRSPPPNRRCSKQPELVVDLGATMTILIEAPELPVERVIIPSVRDLGKDFRVRRALPSALRRMVGPFIFLDHFGPIVFRAGAGPNVRPHPHIGLSTLSYLLEGEMVHRDSVGSVETIRSGDVNWMTAGSGIVHSERSPAKIQAQGGTIFGQQIWVALPKALEE